MPCCEQSQSSCFEYEAICAFVVGVVILCCCCFLMRSRSDYRCFVPLDKAAFPLLQILAPVPLVTKDMYDIYDE